MSKEDVQKTWGVPVGYPELTDLTPEEKKEADKLYESWRTNNTVDCHPTQNQTSKNGTAIKEEPTPTEATPLPGIEWE